MEKILAEQYQKYPLMQIADYLKLIYQAEFAGGHLIENANNSYQYLITESLSDTIRVEITETLYDVISDKYVRINLRPYLKQNKSLAKLNEYFVKSANQCDGSQEGYLHKAQILLSFLDCHHIDYNIMELKEYFKNPHPNHHSNLYRMNYYPAYRVIEKQYLKYIEDN